MEHETQAVEAGSASALRTGDVFTEISDIAQRSPSWPRHRVSRPNQRHLPTIVGRAIKEFTGGAVATQKDRLNTAYD